MENGMTKSRLNLIGILHEAVKDTRDLSDAKSEEDAMKEFRQLKSWSPFRGWCLLKLDDVGWFIFDSKIKAKNFAKRHKKREAFMALRVNIQGNLNLGIILNESGQVINHRPLLKIILNPFLRLIGYELASLMDGRELIGYRVQSCARRPRLLANLQESWCYELGTSERIPSHVLF